MKFRVNDDKKLVEEIRQKLKQNDGYCPCQVTRHPDAKCVCTDFLEQGLGQCHCGLYIKTEV